MANKLSSKKSIRKIKTRTLINKSRLSRVKTYLKKANLALSTNQSYEVTLELFTKAQSEIARAAQKGAIKKNTASRTISRLSSKLKNIARS
ncbi:MAG: 30S ribosomal protein S20 [Chlamydiae bacterium]|nr:30S ribosomal protein S20 [Chlamydiota bacterium]